ncbi:unnamed protein product [Malus baccata var. baccata]
MAYSRFEVLIMWQEKFFSSPDSSLVSLTPTAKLWNKLWKSRVPPKVKVCVWQLCNDYVPTRANLIEALRVTSTNLSPVGQIIEDIKALLSTITEASSSHSRRQANAVAHRLARFGLTVPHEWVRERDLDLVSSFSVRSLASTKDVTMAAMRSWLLEFKDFYCLFFVAFELKLIEETRPGSKNKLLRGVTSEMKFPANPSNSISSVEFGWSSSEQKTNYNGVARYVTDDIIYRIRLHNYGFAVEMKLQNTNVLNNAEDF